MTAEEMERRVGELAKLLKKQLPSDVGFVLMLTDFGEEGSFAYAANVKRDDVYKLLGEAREKIATTGRS